MNQGEKAEELQAKLGAFENLAIKLAGVPDAAALERQFADRAETLRVAQAQLQAAVTALNAWTDYANILPVHPSAQQRVDVIMAARKLQECLDQLRVVSGLPPSGVVA